MASDAKASVKEAMGDAISSGKDSSFDRYEDAKSKAHDTYMFAKDSMIDEAKEKYEAAKEMVSEAAGNLGAKMRTGRTAEL